MKRLFSLMLIAFTVFASTSLLANDKANSEPTSVTYDLQVGQIQLSNAVEVQSSFVFTNFAEKSNNVVAAAKTYTVKTSGPWCVTEVYQETIDGICYEFTEITCYRLCGLSFPCQTSWSISAKVLANP